MDYKKEIIKFVINNGWAIYEVSGDFNCYCKKDNIGIDISDDEVVLIDDTGDYCHMPLNSLAKYTLLGKLFTDHAISIDYRWID